MLKRIKEYFSHSRHQTTSPPITLWGTSLSPYVRKVMVALAEKGLPYQHEEILPTVLLKANHQPVPPAFANASPAGKIPALQIGEFTIADSSAITGYLERKFSTGHALYPTHSEEYGNSLWFERYSDDVISHVVHRKMLIESLVKPILLHQQPNPEIVAKGKNVMLPPVLDYLNQCAKRGTWLAGKNFSMGDIAVVTQLMGLSMMKYEIDNQRWPHLNHYVKKALARPSFSKIVIAVEKFRAPL